MLIAAGRRLTVVPERRAGGPVLAPYARLLGHAPSVKTYLLLVAAFSGALALTVLGVFLLGLAQGAMAPAASK